MNEISRRLIVFGLILVQGALMACSERSTRVVLITIDTLRSDAFAGNSWRDSAMPRTAAIAGAGAVFDHFYSAANTTQPSHATLMTALHPWEHGVTSNGMILAAEHVTLAEWFRDAGYATAAVVAAFPLDQRFGFAQGFDVYLEAFDRKYRESWGGVAVEGDGFYSLSDRITADALDLLEQMRDGRQFFWFHYFDPHGPFGDSTDNAVEMKELVEKAVRRDPDAMEAITRAHRLYEADVLALDAALEQLFQRLREDALEIETHILFVSDHGESFGEEGILGHGTRLSSEQIRVPLFILSPRVAPGRRTDIAGSIDVASTLLSLGSVDAPVPGGRNLVLPPIEGPGSAVGMQGRPLGKSGSGHRVGRNHFYAVVEDVIFAGVAGRVAPNDSPRVRAGSRIADEISPRFADFERQAEAVESAIALDAESREGLRALGYLH